MSTALASLDAVFVALRAESLSISASRKLARSSARSLFGALSLSCRCRALPVSTGIASANPSIRMPTKPASRGFGSKAMRD
eukprot:3935147-Rhodomonas_salina.1